MSGVEVAVGFLIAWVLRRARHVGERVDGMADSALDSALDRLRGVVGKKLTHDPALESLEKQAADQDGEVRQTTRDRVRLALQEATEDDPAFAEELDAAVAGVQQAEIPTVQGVQHVGTVSMGSHSNMFGPVAGNVHIDQSRTLSQEACFCGLHANARCPRCGKQVCVNHYFTTEAAALRYPDLRSPGHRSHPAYAPLFAAGAPRCVNCRFADADATIDEARGFVERWMARPVPLTEQDLRVLAQFPSLLFSESYQPMLASLFQLYEPDVDLVVGSLSATMPAQTKKQRRDYVWPDWTVSLVVERRERAVTVPETAFLISESGLVHVRTSQRSFNQEGTTTLAVSPGVVPDSRCEPVTKRWTPKTGPVFHPEDWIPTGAEVVRLRTIAELLAPQPHGDDITLLFDKLRSAPPRRSPRENGDRRAVH
jgi:hypothetical protein